MAGAFDRTIPRREREALAALLRRTRIEVGVAQQDLAARVGVPESVLSKMETGHRGIGVLELRAVCAALGVPLGAFVARLEGTLEAGEAQARPE